MSKITWKYVTPLKEKGAVEKYEARSGLTLPDDLKNLVTNHNGGMPDLCVFDTERAKEKIIKGLLSFNEDDEENIYDFTDILREYGFQKLIPFALDPFGNIICTDNNSVVFWDHETKETEHVADSVADFIKGIRA